MNVLETKNQNIAFRVCEIHRGSTCAALKIHPLPHLWTFSLRDRKQNQPPTQIKKTVAGGCVPNCRHTTTILVTFHPYIEIALMMEGHVRDGIFLRMTVRFSKIITKLFRYLLPSLIASSFCNNSRKRGVETDLNQIIVLIIVTQKWMSPFNYVLGVDICTFFYQELEDDFVTGIKTQNLGWSFSALLDYSSILWRLLYSLFTFGLFFIFHIVLEIRVFYV